MPSSLQLLQAIRLNAIMMALQDQRELPNDLTFLARTTLTPATDGEIMASYTGYVQIADLVADDSRALTYSNGKFTFSSDSVPNLKLGVNLTQEQLNQMMMLQSGVQSDSGIFTNWQNRTIDGLLLGLRQRMEALIIAMQIDGLSYDRLGIKMSNVTWGMPSDLKVTPSTPWTDPVNATPVSDIELITLVARIRYGQVFNRITMSTQAFRLMVATTEFQNRARVLLAPNTSFVNLSLLNLGDMKNLAERVLGNLQIELYDSRYWTQAPDGILTSQPYLPINKVLLSSTADDNDPTTMDFANGIVTESIVSALGTTSMVGSLGGPQRGPVSYATIPPDLNPPAITFWGVARGFPRKHKRQATAVLTVGTFSDAIPIGAPDL